MSQEQDRPSTQNGIQAEDHLKRELIFDALQYPTTIVPLFGVALAFIFVVIDLPGLPLIGLVTAVALMLAAAAASFIWRFFLRYEEEYGRRLQKLSVTENRARRTSERQALQEQGDLMRAGFTEKGSAEGVKVVDRLVTEFEQIEQLTRTWPQSSLVSISQIRALTEQTFQQGLNVLNSLLYLLPTADSSDREGLATDIQALEQEMENLKENGTDAAWLEIRNSRLSALRRQLELMSGQDLQAEEVLLKANLIEGALSRTRIELAALRAESAEGSQNAVSEALQRTIDQAKEVLDEMRTLGL